MRKHRLLAVLMAVIFMLASLPGITAQADTIGREAQACKELGILIGADKNGVTTQYLSTVPTRLQAYIIALRLKGLYEKAGSYTSSINFSDASAAGWARNYLAYAKNTPELGWGGYPDGRFGVNDKINGMAFYKVLLETLGYKQNVDFTYAQTLEFANKIGLLDDVNEIKSIKSFTINDIAKGIYGALNTNAAGTDKKLVDILTEKGIFKPEKVEAAGFGSLMQIPVKIDAGVAWVPIKDTYTRMGCYVLPDTKIKMVYEIRKDPAMVRLTEGLSSAYINNTMATLEKAVMKDKTGIYYVPVSFVVTTAGKFGYQADYTAGSNVLKLQKLARIEAAQHDIILAKGERKSIKVERIFSDIDKEVITSQCTYTALINQDIVEVGSFPGEITGKSIGNVEISVGYQGKEVDRVIAHVVDVVPKYYTTAYYEQVFETTFKLDAPNYRDGFGAVWNKKSGVKASINEGDSMDTGSSLNIQNYSTFESGVTADLTKLLEDRAIKGKPSTLKISAKALKEGSKLYIAANIKTSKANIKKENSIELDSKWKTVDILKLDIPADAQGLTVDISAGQNEEIRIDAFTMTSN